MKFFVVARRVAVVAAVSLAMSSLSQSASAYPPGQNLTVRTVKSTVLKNRQFQFLIAKARPGRVTIKFNNVTTIDTVGSGGTATVTMPANAYGVFIATAKSGSELATTRIFVPKFSLRNTAGEIVRSGRRGHFLTVRVDYVEFGTVVSVLSGNQVTSKAAWKSHVAKVRFQLPNKPGRATVVVNVAGQNKTIPYWVN